MSTLATTKLSSKGQVVIPEEIRELLDLHTGDKFIVIGDKDTIILKTIQKPSIKNLSMLMEKANKQAKKAGLTKKDVEEAIKKARKK